MRRARGPQSLTESWEAFLNVLKTIEKLKAEIGFRAGEECFYRGQPRREYTLTPSLFRKRRSLKKHIQLEADLFFEFRARAHALHGESLTDWDVLFYMRHHGVPTRLLDWSEAFGVALYFALHDQNGAPIEETPCIHVLNPYKLNEASAWNERDLISPKYIWYGEDEIESWDYGDIILEQIGMDWDTPIAIYPEQRSDRVRAQRGWFTLNGDDLRPLDRQVTDVCRRIEVPHAALAAARQFLDMAGIDHFALFPDLDGLAKTLIEKNTVSNSGLIRRRRTLSEWR